MHDLLGRGTALAAARARRLDVLAPATRVPTSASRTCSPTCSPAISADDLRQAALRALAPRPTAHVEVDHVLVDEVTVAEVVQALASCASCLLGRTSFRALTAAAATRMELVVHFLGLLELYKQGLVDLEQTATFGELVVVWTGGEGDELADEDDRSGGDVPECRASWRQPAAVALGDLDYRDELQEPESTPPERAQRLVAGTESAAIEAVLTVATEPVPPGLLAELLELPVERVEELCAALAASYEAEGARASARAGRRRLPLPEPPRATRLRRALHPRRRPAPALARRRSRRSRSSPTSSRSRGPRWPRSAA